MPLSDHEQRLLEQIERALYAEDPKFATSVRATDLRTHYRRRLIRSAIRDYQSSTLAILVAGDKVTRRCYPRRQSRHRLPEVNARRRCSAYPPGSG